MPVEVPTVGQGTWQMAESGYAADEIAALRAGIARGLTHIDTAEMYGSGARRSSSAQAIKGIPRGDLFLVSKVLPQNASRAGTVRACEQSLRRLGTDYLDVYLLHWRGHIPLVETLAAMEQLVEQGKIRALGVSNFDVDDLEEARGLLRRAPIACNQVLYHLRERHIEAELVAYCRRHDIAVVGYSPFGHGRFPQPSSAARPRAGRGRRAPPRHAPSGGAGVPHPRAAAVHDPEGVDARARRGQRGRAGSRAHARPTSPRSTPPFRFAPPTSYRCSSPKRAEGGFASSERATARGSRRRRAAELYPKSSGGVRFASPWSPAGAGRYGLAAPTLRR